MKKLEQLKFLHIGSWVRFNSKIKYIVHDETYLNVPNSLYAFVVKSQDKASIAYIGKTTQTLGKRFYGYCRGNGKSTNNKIHTKIIDALESSKFVDIWALPDDSPLSWAGLNINLAAGLEDSLITKLNPDWNGSRTETETAEVEIFESEHPKLYPIQESISIGTTYWNHGYINVSTNNSPYLAKHDDPIKIYLGNSKEAVDSRINRKAVANGAVRIGRNLSRIKEYYQKKYRVDDVAQLTILGPNEIRIE